MQQPRVCFQLLGGFAAAADPAFTHPLRISTKKSIALIAILVLSSDMRMRRERLASLLWGSSGEVQARHSLRQALLSLRKDLQHFVVVHSDSSHVWIDPAGVWVDVLHLQRLTASGEPGKIREAYALIRGELLDGLDIEEEEFEDWLRIQRNTIGDASAHVIERYAFIASEACEGETAVAAVDKLLNRDPLREDWHKLALTIYARHRGPQQALALARKLKGIIATELGETLDPSTLQLIDEIRDGAVAPSIINAPPAAVGGDNAPIQPSTTPSAWAARSAVSWLNPRIAVGFAAAAVILVATLVASSRWTSLPAKPQPSTLLPPIHAGVPRLESGTVVLAVLPFTSIGDPSERQSAYADMVTEELTSVLSTQSALRVLSRETANTYKGQRVDAIAVARELGAHYLLEGSVTLRGDSLRINVGLVDGRTGLRVWTQRVERGRAELPEIQDELVNSLGWQLQIEMNMIEGLRPTADPDVHTLIRAGWLLMQNAGLRGASALHEAKAKLDAAVSREPSNTHARLALSWYHVNLAVQLFAEDQDHHLREAEALAKSVIETTPRSAGAYMALGLCEVSRGRLRAAAKHFEQAIQINPSHAGAHAQLGRALMRFGNLDTANEHVQYAMRLSPRDPHMPYWLGFLASIELERRNLGAARRSVERALELNPQQPRNLLVSAAVAALEGKTEKAAETIAGLQRSLPHMRDDVIRKRFSGPEGSEYRRGLDLALAAAERLAGPISIR